MMLTYFCHLVVVVVSTVVMAHEGSNCDGYVDMVTHLQRVSGDCSKLTPDNSASNSNLNGKSWIVHFDSHNESNPNVCEVITLRIDNGKLHSTEVISKNNATVVLHEEMDVVQNAEGLFQGDDEMAVVLHVCDPDTMCMAECGKSEDGEGFGAHVFCASTKRTLTNKQRQCFKEAEKRANDMGLDVQFKQMKGDCEGSTSEEYNATGCHKYMDIVPHHQEISGNCEKLKPQTNFEPSRLNGMSWVVQNDSHAQADQKTCETFEIRFENKTLFTREIIEKGTDDAVTVNLRETMRAEEGENGYTFFESSDESAVFIYASENLDMVVFAECGKLENPEGDKQYGAHVFCGTTNLQMTKEQKEACDQAQQKVNEMGIDVTLKPMKGYCGGNNDD